ncbi:uncharacterized protein [Diadema antillarum]|uniref:uncharacterized protein n=1 Tax=Diadema antillarum TaxID=105358 RepID=UPI003A8454B3
MEDRGQFRSGPTRAEMLRIKKEIEDIKRKSQLGMEDIRKEQELLEQKIKAKELKISAKVHSVELGEDFGKKCMPYLRNSEPHFDEEYLLKPVPPPKYDTGTVPTYNPLNKSSVAPQQSQTKRFPYSKADTVTVEEMRKPHVQTVGVLPVRSTGDVANLNVMLQGKPVISKQDAEISAIQEENAVHSTTPVTTRPQTAVDEVPEANQAFLAQDLPLKPQTPPKKPAILSSTGTLAAVTFQERAKPAPKPRVENPPDPVPRRRPRDKESLSVPKSAKSSRSYQSEKSVGSRRYVNGKTSTISVRSIHSSRHQMTDDESHDSSGDESSVDGGHVSRHTATTRTSHLRSRTTGSAASSGSHKSSSELLQEAQEIASMDSLSRPRKRRTHSKSSRSQGSVATTVHVEKEEEAPKERSVDDIIASLKAQREQGSVKSEADVKIMEIMKRVMSRTAEVLGSKNDGVTEDRRPELDEGLEEEPETEAQEGALGVPEVNVEETDEVGKESMDTDGTGDSGLLKGDIGSRRPSKVSIVSDLSQAPSKDLSDTKPGEEGVDEDQDELELKPSVKFQEAEIVMEVEETEEEEIDLEKAWQELTAPLDVSYADVVKVEGEKKAMQERAVFDPAQRGGTPVQTVIGSSVSFLSMWAPQEEEKKREVTSEPMDYKLRESIHHFCNIPTDLTLSRNLQMVTRSHHAPSKDPATRHLANPLAPSRATTPSNTPSMQERQKLMSAAARRILREAESIDAGDQHPGAGGTGGGAGQEEEGEARSLETWEKRAMQLFDEEALTIVGQPAPIRGDQDISRLYWTPAPPKMNFEPGYIRNILYPEFQGIGVSQELERLTSVATTDGEDADVDVMSSWNEADLEERLFAERIMGRNYSSSEDLTELGRAKYAKKLKGKPPPFLRPTSASSEVLPPEEPVGIQPAAGEESMEGMRAPSSFSGSRLSFHSRPGSVLSDSRPLLHRVRRTRSAPELEGDDLPLQVPTDFEACMEDVKKHKLYLTELRDRKELEEDEEVIADAELSKEGSDPAAVRSEVKSATPEHSILRRPDDGPSLAQQAREAGMKYVIYPARKGKKKKKQWDPRRLRQIEDFLRQQPNKISRSLSLPKIHIPVDPEVRVSKRVRHRRRKSEPSDFDFDQFLKSKFVRREINVRQWVRDLWDEWFDEVYPPSDTASETGSQGDGGAQSVTSGATQARRGPSTMSAAVSVMLEDLDIPPDTEEEGQLMEELYNEALYMTEKINTDPKPSPFDLTRRGIIYRKLGKLKQSWDDLNRAIALEPLLLDAYWHRHLLFLLKEKPTKALEDLNTILKINKDHVGAYRSRAEIFTEMGDVTMAIMNFTQTVKLDPHDHEAFFKRAELYEQRGEMLLALEDYREATRLMPNMTKAIMKRGLYQFEMNKNWMAAIKDFTELLVQEPNNAIGHTYRGRAFAKQGMYKEAVADLSAAVHLDPNNNVAFYHRGCLLRKSHPKQSLQDLSISIMLNDSYDNVMAFFHRGILYMDMGRHEDAITDFDSVLKLDRTIAAAHVNLGLIYMMDKDNYHKAIQKFTNAVKVDPTYVRAFVCRGEAHHKIHDLKNALKDFTRAIHLRPDQQHYYMLRGQILLKMNNLELASFCVRHAAELAHGLGSSPTQQAAVQSFLHNYGRAIDVLSSTAKVSPSAPLYILLGKTEIKAKKYREAVESLEKALGFMKPWQERQTWPMEAAEVYYLIGMCHMEIPNILKAYEAFNSAIKINQDYPEAYYQRGLTRTRLHQAKGILDFNRALALNPKLFQAYLSRAAYYGQRGRYSKGIYNCNQAIRLQPNSVRAYLYRGALKYYIKAFDLAIKDLCQAIELDTTCSLAYFNRAVCYHTVGDYQKAQRDYGIVLMLGEENSLKVLINRGLMYFAQKDYKNARDDFAQAVEVSPRDPKIRHTLGLCCHKLNRLEDAVAIYSSALEVNPFFIDAYLGRGNAFMDYGHRETTLLARRDYQRALLLEPECLVARVNLAYNMQISGQYKLAWNLFSACLQLNPEYRPALEGRAMVSLQMSDPYAALLDMNTALRIAKTAELFVNRGVVNQFLQDHESAMTDYQAAIRKDPKYALAFFNAANLYFSNRQFIQALQFYDKTLELNPSDESALLNRAITKVLMRDARGALEDFFEAVKLSPFSAHLYFNRGNLYTSLKRYQLAENDYSEALNLQPDDPLVYKRRAEVRGKLGKRGEAIQDYKRAIEIQSKKHF